MAGQQGRGSHKGGLKFKAGALAGKRFLDGLPGKPSKLQKAEERRGNAQGWESGSPVFGLVNAPASRDIGRRPQTLANETRHIPASASGPPGADGNELAGTSAVPEHQSVKSRSPATPSAGSMPLPGNQAEAGSCPRASPTAATEQQVTIKKTADGPSSFGTDVNRRLGLGCDETPQKSTPASSNLQGPGGMEPPAKAGRLSGLRSCSQTRKSPVSPVMPNFTSLAETWGEVDSRGLMSNVLTEICRFQSEQIENLVPRPPAKSLKLMRSRLQTFFLKSSMVIETYREPLTPKPPEAAYAAEALTEASQDLDKEMEELRRLEAVMDNPAQMEALLERLGLGLPAGQSAGADEQLVQSGNSSVPLRQHEAGSMPSGMDVADKSSVAAGKSGSSGDPELNAFVNLNNVLGLLHAEAASLAALEVKGKHLLDHVKQTLVILETASDGTAEPLHETSTPHTLWAKVQDAGPTPEVTLL